MALSMLPLNVLADETAPSDVKIGHYDEGGSWAEGAPEQKLPDGVDSVSKTAVPVGDNTYDVTLQVVLKETTTTQTSYAQAATVLVIDTSGSMGEGCQRWHFHNSSCPSRLKDAKTAAINFLNSYKAGGDGRYVALVRFSTGATVAAGWQDVSTPDGYTAILNALDGLSADGGTNLEQGLVNAQNLFNDSTVSVIPAKHVVALTDGEPTYYGPGPDGGNGQYCNQATFDATNDAATNLKAVARLHTISFGTSTENMLKEEHIFKENVYWTFTVSGYLATYVASPESAYSADNADDLNKVFDAISNTITSGLSSGTVHDSLPVGVTSSAIPTGTAGVNWDLKDFDKVEKPEGNTTTYTYTKSYTVTIDPTAVDAEQYDGYYPLNGPTTLTVKDSNQNDVTINFPIPAGKVTFPKQEYSVTYRFTGLPENGTNLPPLPTDSTVYYSGDEVTIQNPSTTTYTFNHKIYTFEGWKLNGTPVSDKHNISDSSLEFVGNWSSEDEPSYTVTYNLSGGTSTSTQLVFTGLFSGDKTPTIKTPTRAGYTFTGWSPKVAETVTGNVIYTAQWTRNYVPYYPPVPPTVKIEDDDALGLNTTDHFAYIVGYGNGEVRPQNNITRAEVATIFFRLLTDDVRDENLTKTNRYSDVAATSWYNTAVSTLSSMGIITGYPDGTFRPNAAITRAEFAAIAARFDNDGDKTAAKFSDIATHWAKDEISIAYNNGWITGYPNGTFGPQRDITRAETMTLVNRVLNRQPETEDDLLPNMTVWTDNANPKAWYYLAVQEATNSHYYKFKTNSKYEKWTELRETRDWTQLEK